MGHKKFARASIVATILLLLPVPELGEAHSAACKNPRDFARNSRDKIVGGDKAKHDQWPGQVAIRSWDSELNKGIYFCGGTLIDPSTVLTARHCLKGFQDGGDGKHYRGDGRIQVILGADKLDDVSNANLRDVEKVIPPEGNHDIAMLRLDSAWNGPISRISLSSGTDPLIGQKSPLMVAGFGLQKELGGLEQITQSDGTIFRAGSAYLQEVAIPFISEKKCRELYPSDNITPAHICAGFDQGGKDACKGDSGGPLVAFDRNGCPYQVGVVNWGDGCARENAPTVYARVSHFSKWISDNTSKFRKIEQDKVAPVTAKPNEIVETVFNTLNDYLGSVNGRATIQLDGANKVAIGDEAVFMIRSQVAGKLILIDINAKGDVAQLYPNRFVKPGALKANQWFSVPDNTRYKFPAQEPIGRGKLVAIIAPESFNAQAIHSGGIGGEAREKGFGVQERMNYFQNLIYEIKKATAGKTSDKESGSTNAARSGGDGKDKGFFAAERSKPLPDWAVGTAEYEIVR